MERGDKEYEWLRSVILYLGVWRSSRCGIWRGIDRVDSVVRGMCTALLPLAVPRLMHEQSWHAGRRFENEGLSEIENRV